MARELKGLGAGLAAGLGVVGVAYGVSAIATRTCRRRPSRAKPKQASVGAEPPAGGETAASQLVATGRALYLQTAA